VFQIEYRENCGTSSRCPLYLARPVGQQPLQITQSLYLRTLTSALSIETFFRKKNLLLRRQHIDHRSRTMTEPVIVGYKVTFMATGYIFLDLVSVSLNFLLKRADMTREKGEQASARTVRYQFRLAHKRNKIYFTRFQET
jgi:hypothetical protein